MKKLLCVLLLVVVLFNGCGKSTEVDYGSFTMDKTYSFDEKYCVRKTIIKDDDKRVVILDVYRESDDMIVYSIRTSELSAFQGYCWENDAYRIWIQTADGLSCYTIGDYEREWVEDTDAVLPDYIVTKANE